MPRGRSRGYELQRETILARAAELFAQRGYTATSMNEVADACGVSKPSLYHYVRDKHQLLAEIAEAHVTRLLALIADVDAAKPAARKAFLAKDMEGLRCCDWNPWAPARAPRRRRRRTGRRRPAPGRHGSARPAAGAR